jgi:hypothetical protein
MTPARTRARTVRGAGTGRRALRRVLPGLADLAGYRRAWLRSDVLAGLAVWAILVPQGLAYGELAGLYGLEERGIRLVLARTRTALRDTLRQLDLEERIGPENFHLRVRDAVAAFSDRASG